MLDRPICIVGAARSGTTVLGHLLARHPEVVYWEEPKYVWQYRKPTAPHDVRTADEATPAVRRYVRTCLDRHVRQGDGTRLLEKTPSNCFRVPFVQAVLPDVRIIHLVRDGRDVAFSARRQWKRLNEGRAEREGGEKPELNPGVYKRFIRPIWTRFRDLEVPWRDFPFYAARYLKTLLFDGGPLWGPRFPGIQTVVASEKPLEVCAIQWREAVTAALGGLQAVPTDQQFELRFEDLVRAPSRILPQILDFADLSDTPALVERAEETLRPEAVGRWKNRDEAEVQRIMEQVGDFVRAIEARSEEGRQSVDREA